MIEHVTYSIFLLYSYILSTLWTTCLFLSVSIFSFLYVIGFHMYLFSASLHSIHSMDYLSLLGCIILSSYIWLRVSHVSKFVVLALYLFYGLILCNQGRYVCALPMKSVALFLEMLTCKNHNVNPLVVSLPSMRLQLLNSISNNL